MWPAGERQSHPGAFRLDQSIRLGSVPGQGVAHWWFLLSRSPWAEKVKQSLTNEQVTRNSKIFPIKAHQLCHDLKI